MNTRRIHKKHVSFFGFTIVELIITIVVIGILAAIVFVSYRGVSRNAISSSLQSDLANSSKKLKMYYAEYGQYPSGLTSSYCPEIGVDTIYCLKASSGSNLRYISTSMTGFTLYALRDDQMYKITESATPSALTNLPTEPTNITVTVGATIHITWGAPSSNGGSAIATYKIYLRSTSVSTVIASSIPSSATYYDMPLASLPIGTYYLKMSASNSNGEGVISNDVQFNR